MDMLLGLFVMAAVPGYFVLQVYAARRWDGNWRWAALAPLIVMVPLLGYTVFALAAGSNLWPLLLILTAPVAFLYLAALAGIRNFAT